MSAALMPAADEVEDGEGPEEDDVDCLECILIGLIQSMIQQTLDWREQD